MEIGRTLCLSQSKGTNSLFIIIFLQLAKPPIGGRCDNSCKSPQFFVTVAIKMPSNCSYCSYCNIHTSSIWSHFLIFIFYGFETRCSCFSLTSPLTHFKCIRWEVFMTDAPDFKVSALQLQHRVIKRRLRLRTQSNSTSGTFHYLLLNCVMFELT